MQQVFIFHQLQIPGRPPNAGLLHRECKVELHRPPALNSSSLPIDADDCRYVGSEHGKDGVRIVVCTINTQNLLDAELVYIGQGLLGAGIPKIEAKRTEIIESSENGPV